MNVSIVVIYIIRIFLFLFNFINKPLFYIDYNYRPKVAKMSYLVIKSIGFKFNIFICIIACLVAIKAGDVA